jgi:CRISPR/Cas system-associated endonuclease Cas3-HD
MNNENKYSEIINSNDILITVSEDSNEFKKMITEINELKNIIKDLNNIVINQNEAINNNIKSLNDLTYKINKLDIKDKHKVNLVYDYLVPVLKVIGLGILKSSSLTVVPYIVYKILK